MLKINFVMPTTHSGDLLIGSTESPNRYHAAMVIEMYRRQHPEFSKKVRYEVEERDADGNLVKRIFG